MVNVRYISNYIKKDLSKKMVMVTGPRQSGKTTLVKSLLVSNESLYLNWDDTKNRKRIINRDWSDETKIIAFDEIHKFSRWKNFVKGIYDTQKDRHSFIITGSARLDTFKKGQDSLLGRFFTWRLHPLCTSELVHYFKWKPEKAISLLMQRGGFPEPFFEDETFAKRWRNERLKLVFRQDIQELESIRDISLLELFYQSIQERIGGQVVLSNIARDLEIAPKTAKVWLYLLEKSYLVFSVSPYSRGITRAITKTPKVYSYDNGEISRDNQGALFENLIANHLLKRLNFLEDLYGDRYELNYLRDKEGHEVDFVILKNKKLVMLIEVKLHADSELKGLRYFKEKLGTTQCMQLVLKANPKDLGTRNGIKTVLASEWLAIKLEEEIF